MLLDSVSAKLLGKGGEHGPLVLMYHSLEAGNGNPSWPWAVNYRRFLEQLDILQKMGWKTGRLSEFDDRKNVGKPTVFITFDDGYADNYPAFEALAARDMKATWFIVSGEIGRTAKWAGAATPAKRLLSSAQIKQMHQGGMEIGSHSSQHAVLEGLPQAQVCADLSASKNALEDIVGDKVESFAYPYGQYDHSTIAAVEEVGFRFACSCRTGWALVQFDPLQIRRVAVFNSDSASHFARKLAFGENNVSWTKVAKYYWRRLRAKAVLPNIMQ